MKVLVVGSGGREHAIVHALSKSNKVTEIYAAPGNAGIAKLAVCVNIKDTDVSIEASNYVKYQILQQSSATLLATANQQPSMALNLI